VYLVLRHCIILKLNSNLDGLRQFVRISHAMISRVTVAYEPRYEFALSSCVVQASCTRCDCLCSLDIGYYLDITEGNGRIMTIRSSPVNKSSHRLRVNTIVKWRLPVLRDPDLSMWLGQIELTT